VTPEFYRKVFAGADLALGHTNTQGFGSERDHWGHSYAGRGGESVHGLAVHHLDSYVNLCHNSSMLPVHNRRKHPELHLFKEPHSATPQPIAKSINTITKNNPRVSSLKLQKPIWVSLIFHL